MKKNYWHQLKKPFLLPDIGTFFNQDIELAKTLVKQVAESGLKIIKGEILHNADICLANSCQESYLSSNSEKMINEDYRKLIERKTVSLSDYEEIFSYAKSLGLELIVSVYDFEGADFAKSIDCIAIKVATSNITHQPLIEHIAKLNLPMIIDTGGSSLEEISRAINWANDAGNFDLLIEHSPPPPPHSIELHNLNYMTSLAEATNLPVGLSDHHHGEEMLYAAIALGAKIVEKGLCADNLGDEQDGRHALKISELNSVVKKINNIAVALGDGKRELARNRPKKKARMGITAKTNIKLGDKLTLDNLTFAFPLLGIGTEHWSEILDKPASGDILVGTPLTWRDIGN